MSNADRIEARAQELNREALRLVAAFRRGEDVKAEAERLHAQLVAIDPDGLPEDDARRILRIRNEAAIECRWITSDGTGPTSLRMAHSQR